MKDITLLGIDIAKQVFQFHGTDARGHTVMQKKVKRSQVLKWIANLPPCCIAMEACGGANYWARQFQAFGHEVKLISPQFVKPYVKTNKNDRNDAQAINEAASRPHMRFVTPKSIEQQLSDSLGQPWDVSRTVFNTKTREIWKYEGIGKHRYALKVILDDGQVVEWDKK